ncbi:MAG: carbohydrate ABC transporter permease [Geminicoccaceae bacterium]
MRRRRWIHYALALLICAWVLFPIYLIAISAFGTRDAVFAWPKAFFPDPISLDTLGFFFGVAGVWKAVLNSIVVAVMTMVLAIGLGAPAGYALARFPFRGKDAFRLLILLTRAFPLAILAVPLVVRFIQLGIYDTVLAVALVHTALALPFAVLVSASLFMGVPRELEEAAWTMGCTRFQAFRRVVLPLVLPGIAATALFAFVISWNEVFAATILTLQNRTLTAFLLSVLDESPLAFRFAGGLFLIVPALIFLFVVRKYLFSMWGIANR